MTKRVVVVIVALLASLLFSGPDPMLYFLPVLALAVGPVIILFPVTEENSEFFVRSSECWILEFPQTKSYNMMLNCILQTWPSFSFALQLELSADKKETPSRQTTLLYQHTCTQVSFNCSCQPEFSFFSLYL